MTAPPRQLLHVFATFATGGPQVRFATIANHFGPRYRHAVVAMDGNTACRERLDPALDVTFPTIDMRKGDTLGNLRRFRAVLRATRPDALITNNWGSIEWAMANALPLARHIHIEDGFGPEERDRQIPRRVWTRRLLLRRSTIVLPSRRLLEIANTIWRLPPSRLVYLPNGIDLDRFASGRPPRSPGAPVVVGTVAALRAEKSVGRLIRAAAVTSPPVSLLIVGDGPERPGLEALSADLGLGDRVRFVGHQADPRPFLEQMDIFALSSDTEQMPLSLLEAMASALPVAATDVGDVRHMLAPDNATAELVTQREDAALAMAIGRLADDAALRARLGQANRARAEAEFDQRRMFDAYAALFDGSH